MHASKYALYIDQKDFGMLKNVAGMAKLWIKLRMDAILYVWGET